MILALAARGVQIFFAAVVLALSIILIRTYGPGHAPSIFDYGAFCGGVAIVIAFVGVVANFIDALQGVIMLALDGLTTFFLLAGGLAFAIKSGVGNCGSDKYLGDHLKIFAPSVTKFYPGVGDSEKKQAQHLEDDTHNRCRMVQADTAFIWFTFGLYVVTTILVLINRRGKRGGAIV